MKKIVLLLLLFFGYTASSQETVNDTITEIYSTKGLQSLPAYPGGLAALYKNISENFKPTGFGDMLVTFVVEKDGSVSDINIVEGMNDVSDKRLKKIIKKGPKWKPGIQNNKPVRVRFNLPVRVR